MAVNVYLTVYLFIVQALWSDKPFNNNNNYYDDNNNMGVSRSHRYRPLQLASLGCSRQSNTSW